MASEQHYKVLIAGGGTAGITVAASLRKRDKNVAIAIIEPADIHYYQPAFTLVGAGTYNMKDTQRPETGLIPANVKWVQEAIAGFDPDNNRVMLASGDQIAYDYLVVCTGLKLDWDRVEGLSEAIGKNGVCSNYSPDYAEYTWTCIQNLQSGAKALFTQPPMPFKCPGAPQKIAYLCSDYLRKEGLLDSCDVRFCTHMPAMFGVPFFAKELKKVADRYGIKVHFQHNLVAVDGAQKKAIFEAVGGDNPGERITLDYDMLHVTPPQGPIDVVKASPLANEAGYVEVHQHSMRSTKYDNVFALGDACSTPNSKTAAAIRKQSPIVVRNLMHLMKGETVEEGYDGYASCPLTTAYGKVMMAEFIYGGKVTPTFPLDPRKERWINWWIKKTGLPLMYWNYMLKGYEWFFDHNTNYQEPSD